MKYRVRYHDHEGLIEAENAAIAAFAYIVSCAPVGKDDYLESVAIIGEGERVIYPPQYPLRFYLDFPDNASHPNFFKHLSAARRGEATILKGVRGEDIKTLVDENTGDQDAPGDDHARKDR